MNAIDLIQRRIAERKAAGLSIRAYGAEGYTVDQPFTCHALSPQQRDHWRAQMEAKGFTVQAEGEIGQ